MIVLCDISSNFMKDSRISWNGEKANIYKKEEAKYIKFIVEKCEATFRLEIFLKWTCLFHT